MTPRTLASRKVTLSVAPKRRMLLNKIKMLAGKSKRSISEQVWELCERGLNSQTENEPSKQTRSLPSTDLGGILIVDRQEVYDDILADRF